MRGETLSGDDWGGMGIQGGRVMGRGRKGLTYLGAEVGGSGRAGAMAVAWTRRMGGCSEDGKVKKWVGPEWRLGRFADSEGTSVVNEAKSEKKALNFEAGVLGRSCMLMLLLLGAHGV